MKKEICISTIIASLLSACGWGGWSSTPSNTQKTINNAPDTSKLTKVIGLKENSGKKVFDILSKISDKDKDPISIKFSNLPSYIIYKDWKITIDTDALDVADNQTKTDVLDVEISDGKDVVTKKVTVNITDEANDAHMTSNLTLENITKGQDLEISLALNDADAPNAGTLPNTIDATISSDNFADRQVTLNLENGVYKATVSGLDAWDYTFKTEEITPVISGENPQGNVVVEKGFEVKEANTPPVAIDWNLDSGFKSTYTFSLNDFISDNEDNDSDLTPIIVTQPTWGNWHIRWTISISGTNITINMNAWESWPIYIEYKVRDKDWLESEVKRINIKNMDNA